ncbi:hypothetical protein LV89_01853 [Arcicella aurantiaca]|uniref:Uncharacterized protein n=1 Tax=Arcicella aurantiaca TaxID=591202 RepID=A0A316EAS3_9BACT|nr:hypothetical protein [Arcicella aurantiaca]PWK27041.1 hypothetical protein LV89_01853 [Arcicella aurantiaca]
MTYIFYDEVQAVVIPNSLIIEFGNQDDTGFKHIVTAKGKFYYSEHFIV